jgi:hypothetical protein
VGQIASLVGKNKLGIKDVEEAAKIQKEKAGNGEVAGLDIGSGYSDLSFYFFILV